MRKYLVWLVVALVIVLGPLMFVTGQSVNSAPPPGMSAQLTANAAPPSPPSSEVMLGRPSSGATPTPTAPPPGAPTRPPSSLIQPPPTATPRPVIADLAPDLPTRDKDEYVIRHPDGTLGSVFAAPGTNRSQVPLGPGDVIVSVAPPASLMFIPGPPKWTPDDIPVSPTTSTGIGPQ